MRHFDIRIDIERSASKPLPLDDPAMYTHILPPQRDNSQKYRLSSILVYNAPMKWPETLTLIRHDTSAYNALKHQKEQSSLYRNFK